MDGGQRTTPTTADPLSARLHPGLSALLLIGPIALFLATTAFGILEVHSSTDTWIGLAAGRQIFTADEFPKTDTFSYTFNGKIWYNQNWLTHLFQYWLYSHVSPNAVIYGTWALAASVFVFTLLAAYWRSGTWVGALLAAAAVGFGCRDFLSARPATTGYFCIAALWALICAIEGQREKRRWWPIVLLLPLLLIWGNAHGSFVFGYAVLLLYVGQWVLYWVVNWLDIRGFRLQMGASGRQIGAIVGVVAAALILTVAFGPFGTHNFTHGQKVAGSSVFRQVSEWNPPFERDRRTREITLKPDLTRHSFPPMARFWSILPATLGVLLAGTILCLVARFVARAKSREPPTTRRARKKRPVSRSQDRDAPPAPGLHVNLCDVALVVVGLSMTFWARRFAPIFYIFGAPVFLCGLLLLMRPLPRWAWRYGRWGLTIAAAVAAILVARYTWDRAYRTLVADFQQKPQFNLLERVTRYDMTPHSAVLFLKNNNVSANIVTEWTQAGPVMFYASNAKVFMDGRAQQVYDENHYNRYAWLLVSPDTPAPYRMRILDESESDAVLLRRTTRVLPLWRALEQSGQWVPVLLSPRDGLFLRRGSRGLEQLGELLRRGEEWRPKTGMAMAARAFVWEALDPPGLEEAVLCWQAALEQNILTGALVFQPLTRTLLELGRLNEADRLVRGYYQRVSQAGQQLPEASRRQLLETLSECWAEIQSAVSTSRPSGPGVEPEADTR